MKSFREYMNLIEGVDNWRYLVIVSIGNLSDYQDDNRKLDYNNKEELYAQKTSKGLKIDSEKVF